MYRYLVHHHLALLQSEKTFKCEEIVLYGNVIAIIIIETSGTSEREIAFQDGLPSKVIERYGTRNPSIYALQLLCQTISYNNIKMNWSKRWKTKRFTPNGVLPNGGFEKNRRGPK